MLTVKTPDEVYEIISENFGAGSVFDLKFFESKTVKTVDSIGRVLHCDIISEHDVPGFDRSTVDGYAVIASDTFGASEGIPAVLNVLGDVPMGDSAKFSLSSGNCVGISTGGDLPDGCDAAVMLEHTEVYGDGLIGVLKPVAPGNNVIYRSDDVSINQKILDAGTVLSVADVGILSALGYGEVAVRACPTVGVISTGDELVLPSKLPKRGQIRDVNLPMLISAVSRFACSAVDYGIIRDEEHLLRNALLRACEECDVVLVSGGSSAGLRDLTAKIIEKEGKLLLHGIAMKPGKPTILGIVCGKPVFGLPGHPVAAYFVTELFVRYLIETLTGAQRVRRSVHARLGEAISSNHGRAEYIAVRLRASDSKNDDFHGSKAEGYGDRFKIAIPVKGKSGLITGLAGVEGYIAVSRDCEGLAKGEMVEVFYF